MKILVTPPKNIVREQKIKGRLKPTQK